MLEPSADPEGGLSAADLHDAWSLFSMEERVEGFRLLGRSEAEDFYLGLSPIDQAGLLRNLPLGERRSWMRLLAPDDAADLIQSVATDERETLLALLDEPTRKEVAALLAYAEDEAGGLMNTRYARVRPSATVDEAIGYLRKQARAREQLELLYYAYVIDADQKLLGVVSFRDLFAASTEKTVRDVMSTEVVTVRPETNQEEVSRLFAQHDLLAIPVVDADGKMQGIVTVDDIVDVVEEEATEDIQKIGGMEALDEPYLEISMTKMIRKRAGWLCALFVSEMLTSNAMTYFQSELERAVVLMLFVPLVMSSGGNSGSQATTLVIRAMALGEVKLRDWFRVVRRELTAGLSLGVILGVIGVFRIILWPGHEHLYTSHYMLVAVTIGFSLVGIVLWGTMAGSMLPFLLRRIGFDPASASAPFVATLVDVSGLIIYFSVAKVILSTTLLASTGNGHVWLFDVIQNAICPASGG
jgi:magnesium transporter